MSHENEPAQTRYIFEAIESIRLAKHAEEQFEHENASRLYDTAVHLFITGVQKDSNKERQDLVRKKLAKCLAKAERCRAYVKGRKVQPGDSEFSNSASAGTRTTSIDTDDPTDVNSHVPLERRRRDGAVPGKKGRQNTKQPSVKTTDVEWPHDLCLYQLKQVITSDIWLVARMVDNDDTNLALMVGVPRVTKSKQGEIATIDAAQHGIIPYTANQNQETLEAIDTSQLPHYELGKALSLRIAAIMYRPNRYHVTTGQKFLQQFITEICLEIRTQFTLFCLVKKTPASMEYARRVRSVVNSIRHQDCQTNEANSCQACRLRRTQRTIIRLSSSGSSGSEEHDDNQPPFPESPTSKPYRNEQVLLPRKFSDQSSEVLVDRVRSSLQLKNDSRWLHSTSSQNTTAPSSYFTQHKLLAKSLDIDSTDEGNDSGSHPTTLRDTVASTNWPAGEIEMVPGSFTSQSLESIPTPLVDSGQIHPDTGQASPGSDLSMCTKAMSSTPTSGVCSTNNSSPSSNGSSRCASSEQKQKSIQRRNDVAQQCNEEIDLGEPDAPQ